MVYKTGGSRAQARLCCLALLCAALNASAQSVPSDGAAGPKLIPRTKAQREQQYTVHLRILINVQVADSSGHAVTGLDATSFTLKVNRHPEKIVSFRPVQDGGATADAHAFFLVDMLNNSARDLALEQKAIAKLSESARLLPLPTSLAVLTEKGMEVGRASRNAQDLAAELKQSARNDHLSSCTEDWNNAALGKDIAITSLEDVERVRNRGKAADRVGDCLNEKYRLSFTALVAFARHQQDVPGRAILIWIGPGWPVLSGSGFSPDTPDVRQRFFGNLVQASTQLREGQVTLDAVSWPASSPIAKLSSSDLDSLMRETSTAAQAGPRSVAMPALAHISGGQVYVQQKDLAQELAACLADANSYYVLGFDSAPSAVTDEFRAIEVTVDRPGVTVRTSTGYFAQP